MSTLYIVSNADVIFVDTREGTMGAEKKLRTLAGLWWGGTEKERYYAEAISALFDERDALTTERDTLRAMLRRLEWLDMGHAYPICPVCEGHEHEGHAAGCELAALAEGIKDAGAGGIGEAAQTKRAGDGA